jgi:hypothetical protein
VRQNRHGFEPSFRIVHSIPALPGLHPALHPAGG